MKKMDLRWACVLSAAVVLIAAGLLTGCGGGASKTAQKEGDGGTAAAVAVNAEGYHEVSAIGMTFQWKIVGSDLEMVLSGPTEGWVAAGFDPDTMMKGADFILAYVKDGQVSVSDQYGNQLTSHKPDDSLGGANNVTVVSGTETDGTTRVVLRIPLDSGDKYDRVLAAGQKHRLLLAYGPADDFTTQHTNRVALDLQL